MSETLTIDAADEDDLDTILDEIARDRNEDGWTVLVKDRDGDQIHVRVSWESDGKLVLYGEERLATTDDDRIAIADALDHAGYTVRRTDLGNWRIFRGEDDDIETND